MVWIRFLSWIYTVVHVSLRAFSLSMRAVLTGSPKVSRLVLGAVVVAFGRCGPSQHLEHYRLALRLPGSTGGLGGAQLSSHPSFDRRPSASGRNLIRPPHSMSTRWKNAEHILLKLSNIWLRLVRFQASSTLKKCRMPFCHLQQAVSHQLMSVSLQGFESLLGETMGHYNDSNR